MNELMLTVEKIVRPVSARQSRKLRMRTDLLAHLQAAFEEELLWAPGDEAAALQQARLRLGEPGALTAALQQTVPRAESLLLGRLPLSPRLERLEKRTSHLPGKSGRMTLGHISLLTAVATTTGTPFSLSLLSALRSVDMQTVHLTVAGVGGPLGWYALLYLSFRFVFGAAGPEESWASLLRSGAAIFALQLSLAFFNTLSVADRMPTAGELLICSITTTAFLMGAGAVGKAVAARRQRYDEWLMLDVV